MQSKFLQSQPNRAARTHRGGFTLIELLVVIAIIAILAAILFPVFQKVRENARRTQCVSNMKQIGTAVVQYNQDYDEKFPLADDLTAANKDWSQTVQPYIKNGTMNTNTYTTQGGVFSCPDFIYPNQNNQFVVRQDAFGQNSPDPTKVRASASLAQIDAPAGKIMMWEVGGNTATYSTIDSVPADEWFWTDGMKGGTDMSLGKDFGTATDGWQGPGDCDNTGGLVYWGGCASYPRYRHTSMSNFLYLDGHVKAVHRGNLNWYRDIYDKGLDAAAGTPW